jgi:hypothetical protein
MCMVPRTPVPRFPGSPDPGSPDLGSPIKFLLPCGEKVPAGRMRGPRLYLMLVLNARMLAKPKMAGDIPRAVGSTCADAAEVKPRESNRDQVLGAWLRTHHSAPGS